WRPVGVEPPRWSHPCDGTSSGNTSPSSPPDVVRAHIIDAFSMKEQIFGLAGDACYDDAAISSRTSVVRSSARSRSSAIASNGVYCGRRITKLYGAGRLFACRHCYRLAYTSQQESAHLRGLWKSQKIRMRQPKHVG